MRLVLIFLKAIISSFRTKFICTASLFVCGTYSFAGAESPTCHGFDGTTPQEAVEYLKQDRASLEDVCIMKAIQIVAEERYRPAMKTLFRYLDFEKPPAGVPHAIDLSVTGGVYPVANILAHFGEEAIPDLKLMIRNDDATPLARANAAQVYFAILRSPEVVGFVAKAGHEAVDPAGSKKLIGEAEMIVKYDCSPDQKEACRKALDSSQ